MTCSYILIVLIAARLWRTSRKSRAHTCVCALGVPAFTRIIMVVAALFVCAPAMAPLGPPGAVYVCVDDCHSANGHDNAHNGLCNDGGPGSEYHGWVNCPIGHDCTDCGVRWLYPSPPPAAPAPSPMPAPPGVLCTNTCPPGGGLWPGSAGVSYISNGQCEDNGPGSSLTDNCPLGTDCADCGPRFVAPPPSPPPPSPMRPPPSPSLPPYVCSNTCGWSDDNGKFYKMAHNGQCNDGGPGAEFSQCAIGTDCADCYFRFESGLVGLYGDQNPMNCVGGQYNKCPQAGTKLKPLGSISTTGSGRTSDSSSSTVTSGSSTSGTSSSPPSTTSTLCYNDCTVPTQEIRSARTVLTSPGTVPCALRIILASYPQFCIISHLVHSDFNSTVLMPLPPPLFFLSSYSSCADRWPWFRIYDGLPLWPRLQ